MQRHAAFATSCEAVNLTSYKSNVFTWFVYNPQPLTLIYFTLMTLELLLCSIICSQIPIAPSE